MPKKLPERFVRVDTFDQDSFKCKKCNKIRAICRFCDLCYEDCTCAICDLCEEDEPCMCFYCPDCHQKIVIDDRCVDDGNYDNESFNPKVYSQDVCKKCHNKRVKKWETLTKKKGIRY